jgi:hypothetical protein
MVDSAPMLPADPVRVRVVGPEAACLGEDDLQRLFRGRTPTPARRERMRRSGRVLAACGDRIVGLAAYEREGGEVRVHEFGVDDADQCRMDEISTVLLEALETACLAGGGRRLTLLPRAAVAVEVLRARGFLRVAESSGGFEKRFPS